MQAGILSYVLLGGLAITLLVAAFTDLRHRVIANRLNLVIALAAPLFWLASGMGWVDIGLQIALTTAVFVVLLGFFAAGWMGGGDVKLLTALALWIQPTAFAQLLVVMSIAGGLLTVAMLVRHKLKRGETGQIKVPYGVAISAAGIWILATQYFPAFHLANSVSGT